MFRHVCAALVALMLAAPAAAQSVSAGNSTEMAEYLRSQGLTVEITTAGNGNPLLTTSSKGLNWQVYYYNCQSATVCDSMQFVLGFSDIDITPDQINAWNRDKRFGRAFTSGSSVVVQMDVVVEGGLSRATLAATMDYWNLILELFPQHIGWR